MMQEIDEGLDSLLPAAVGPFFDSWTRIGAIAKTAKFDEP
jgi:hypothetical protein